MGYSSLIKYHYGYIGRWMATYGKLLEEYVGKQFKLRQNEKEVYSSNRMEIKRRSIHL